MIRPAVPDFIWEDRQAYRSWVKDRFRVGAPVFEQAVKDFLTAIRLRSLDLPNRAFDAELPTVDAHDPERSTLVVAARRARNGEPGRRTVAWSADEVDRLTGTLRRLTDEEDREWTLRAWFTIAVATGARPGETFALRWAPDGWSYAPDDTRRSYLDLGANLVVIRSALQWESNRPREKGTKTGDAGSRVLLNAFDDEALAFLRRYRAWQADQARRFSWGAAAAVHAADNGWDPLDLGDLVLRTGNGLPLRHSVLTHALAGRRRRASQVCADRAGHPDLVRGERCDTCGHNASDNGLGALAGVSSGLNAYTARHTFVTRAADVLGEAETDRAVGHASRSALSASFGAYDHRDTRPVDLSPLHRGGVVVEAAGRFSREEAS